MKKLKSRIIGVILILTVIFVYMAFVPEINAEEEGQATEAQLCESAVNKYGLYIKNTQNPDEFQLIKEATLTCDGKIHDAAGFKIISINGVGDTTGKTVTKSNPSVTFKSGYLTGDEVNEYIVTVVVQNIDDEAETITVEYSEIREPASKHTNTKVNPQWGSTCATLKAGFGNDAAKEAFYKSMIPYCWNYEVTYTYTDAELDAKIASVDKIWTAYNNQNNLGGQDFNTVFNEVLNKAKMQDPTTGKDNFVLDPRSTTLTLKCAYDRISTGSNEPKTYTNQRYNESVSSLEYYLNKDYYYSTKETIEGKVTYIYNYAPGNSVKEVHDVCKRTCTEAVKVEYGPPVASKAGLCFEYKVKATSYVKCTAEIIAPQPKNPTGYCNPAPICYKHNTDYQRTLEQAGPTEEFENCINSCDGGKYTEKCSIKCYNQVYGSKNKKLTINYEDSLLRRTASTTEAGIYSEAQCLKDNANAFGCYVYNGDAIDWLSLLNYSVETVDNQEKAVFKSVTYNRRYALGRWYIDRVYKKADGTYLDEWNEYANYNRAAGGYEIRGIYYSCKDDAAACGKYVADDHGVYRQNKGNGNLCNDDCHWRYIGDKESKSGNTTGMCTKEEYLNPGTMEKDAKSNQAAYDDAIKSCLGTATCSEHTAEFTISVNYDTPDGEKVKVNTITFPYESKADTLNANKPNNIADRSRSTILQYDGCYANKDAGNYYMTEWSFPGTYIHNKTGEISFKRPDVTDGWYYDDKKFCMPLDADSVNTKWWEWAKLGNTCYTNAQIQDELKGKTGTSNGYNISAKAKKFGYFGWNFDIKCFYALRNEICNIQDNGCCGTNKKESNGVSNYTFRSIALDNMFPNAAQEGVVDPDKRQIGFNWTSKAMSLKNGAYEVNPTALINHIESTASMLHSSDATELDYKFYLTPASLAKIKQYNNNHDYASWDGTVEEKNGINVYKSNLFRNVGSGNKVLTDIGGAVIKVGEPGVNNENYIAYGG